MWREVGKYLLRDRRIRLCRAAERTSLEKRESGVWLLHWTWICALLALALFVSCGYHAGFVRLNAVAGNLPEWLWQWITIFGDQRFILALALLIGLRYPRIFWSMLLAALIAIVYTRGFKEGLDTLRPPGVLEPGSFHLIGVSHQRSGFPSGHSVTAALFFGVLLYYARHWSWRVLCVAGAVAVGASRVAVGVHWPIDVLAGLAGGALAAWGGIWLAHHWHTVAEKPVPHLIIVLVCLGHATSLLVSCGGYPQALWLVRGVGILVFSSGLLAYFLLPFYRYRVWRRRVDDGRASAELSQ